jgi:hypothetical protein
MTDKPPHRRLSGQHNQCASCDTYFNSTHAFDAHRYGEWGILQDDGSYSPSNRRCLTADEMEAKGMCLSSTGWWITKASSYLHFEKPF